jgi:hypothetical protein
MLAESIVSWESVALVAAVCAGVVGVLRVRRNGGVSEDRVKTLVHEATTPILAEISRLKVNLGQLVTRTDNIKADLAKVVARTEDIWAMLKLKDRQ